MKEPTTRLTEYGIPIDPDAMVTPPDVTELELEPGHPGLGDDGVHRSGARSCSPCAASTGWSASARRSSTTPPEETRIWREVSPKLDELHVKHACQIYLKAKRELAITHDEIPQLRHLSERRPARDEHAPGPGRGGAAVPHLLRVHRRARLPGDAVHPPRLAPGVHARAGHDPRLPRPRPAADEPATTPSCSR